MIGLMIVFAIGFYGWGLATLLVKNNWQRFILAGVCVALMLLGALNMIREGNHDTLQKLGSGEYTLDPTHTIDKNGDTLKTVYHINRYN